MPQWHDSWNSSPDVLRTPIPAEVDQAVVTPICIWLRPCYMKVTQSCPTLWDPMDCTVRGILQARIVKWVAFPFSRGSSQPRDWTQVCCIAGRFFTSWATREVCVTSSFGLRPVSAFGFSSLPLCLYSASDICDHSNFTTKPRLTEVN